MSTNSTQELTEQKNSITVYQTYNFKKSFRGNYGGIGQGRGDRETSH